MSITPLRPPRARRGPALLIAALLAGAGAVLIGAAPAPAAPGPASSGPSTRPVEDAMARARATGRPVEVASATSPTEQTFANPNGTFTTNLNPQPVRVRRGDTWTGLDATLRKNPDGTYSPAASATPLVISGGGTAPFASMRTPAAEFGLKWPGKLPAPVVAGPTATYAGVLPGVDLAVTATEQGGFSHVLIVHTAAAAADPAVRALRLEAVAPGLTVKAGDGGDLAVLDRVGRAVFTAPRPFAWDSSTAVAAGKAAGPEGVFTDGEPARSSVRRPGAAAKRHGIGVTVGADNAITLRPDPAMSKDPAVTYPLYLDPSWNPSPAAASRSAWTYVNSYYSTTKYYNSGDYARAGYAGWESPYYKARSFFQFGVPSNIWGSTVIKATLQLKSVWSASNNTNNFGIYRTCAISSQTSWDAQPCKGAVVASGNLPGNWRSDGSPNPMQHDFDVKSVIVDAAAGRWSAATLGLYNATETDRDTWRKFQNNPTIAIEYNSVPNVPTRTGTSPSVPCAGGQVGNTAVTFAAQLSDPDGAQSLLEGQFSVVDETAGSTLAAPAVTVSNYQTASISIPASSFANGHTYAWNVRASDGRDTSAPTATCRFTINQNQPSAPAVTSTVYPRATTGAPAGTPGIFTFTPPAGSDPPVSYVYSLNVEPTAVLPGTSGPYPGGTLIPAAAGGAPTPVTLTPRRFGPNKLYVYALNVAGNPGATSVYDFTTDAPAQPAVAGDFTGDGRPDVLNVGTAAHPGAWLHPGVDGTGRLAPGIQVGAAGTGGAAGTVADWVGSSVSAADFTGDGVQDVLVRLPASNADGNVHFIPGVGDGSAFLPLDRTQVRLPRVDGGEGSQFVDQIVASHLPSITGSPLPDLYAIVGDILYVYPPGFPPGSYEAPIALSSGWTGRTVTAAVAGTQPALFARTNAGGKVELLTGDTANGVFPGTAGRPSLVYSTAGFPLATTPTVAGADINADGRPDLWSNVGHLMLKANVDNGSGGFGTAVTTTIVPPPPGDVDGDGRTDVLGMGQSGNDLWYVPNTSLPGAPSRGQSKPMGTGWQTVTRQWLVDYDGDGKDDIVGLNGTDQLLVWRNTSSVDNPSYSAYVSLGTGWSTLTRLVFGDFTGDGKVDIAGWNAGSRDQLWVVPNTSSGTTLSRGDSIYLSSFWSTVTSVFVADYDADGKDDLLGLNGTDQLLAWRGMPSNGIPAFGAYTSLGTGWSTLTDLVLGDFTGDGKVDIAGWNAGSRDQLWIVPNTSSGTTLSRGTSIYMSSFWSTVTTHFVADYDADGRDDLLGLNGTDQLVVWRGAPANGVPAFSAMTSLGTGWNSISRILPTA